MGEADLAHKVLAVAEEEGADSAAYGLKLLQPEGELSIATTGKDNASGRLVTHTYRVVGPVAIMLTTTAIDVDEELLNRCIVLSVDEDREQTRAIHDRQRHRQTLAGVLCDQHRHAVLKVHQDAQRLLDPVAVVNPFAEGLTFTDGRTRARRDHVKYLTLIRAVSLLHQHQRPRKTATTPDGQRVAYIGATVADVAVANRLAHEVLGRSLDELPLGTRRLLEILDGTVAERAAAEAVDRDQVRITRCQVREATGWGDAQLKVHLARVELELELVVAHRAERGAGFVYELAWDGRWPGRGTVPDRAHRPRHPRLRPWLRRHPVGARAGSVGAWSGGGRGSGRGVVGGWSAPGRTATGAETPRVPQRFWDWRQRRGGDAQWWPPAWPSGEWWPFGGP